MGFRFSRRISIFKGLRLNLSKSGPSVSVGGRGAWLTFGKKGTRATVGIPGTGMSWSEKIDSPNPQSSIPDPQSHKRTTFLFAGKFIPKKRVSDLLEAAAKVPEARVVLVGDGPLRSERVS